MRTHVLALCAALVGVFGTAPAEADLSWSGSGWYVEATATGLDIELVSGPYADENACTAARPADTSDYAYDCVYEQSDPNADNPPPVGLRTAGRRLQAF